MAKRKYYDPEGICIITGFKGVDLHHWKKRGNGGTDGAHNLMPLKHELHNKAHDMGPKTFANTYPQAKKWLLNNGWEFDVVLDRWTHEKERGK